MFTCFSFICSFDFFGVWTTCIHLTKLTWCPVNTYYMLHAGQLSLSLVTVRCETTHGNEMGNRLSPELYHHRCKCNIKEPARASWPMPMHEFLLIDNRTQTHFCNKFSQPFCSCRQARRAAVDNWRKKKIFEQLTKKKSAPEIIYWKHRYLSGKMREKKM